MKIETKLTKEEVSRLKSYAEYLGISLKALIRIKLKTMFLPRGIEERLKAKQSQLMPG